ncbi:hypothetical protein GCM10011374_35780 [Kocuria dechangensis]|uniref:SGNH hydrolase-type esterase domain-containing protein n=1 Tax=Kocuria dechangensis TaxID=1176249 RepID=A0A917H5N9_9MICC|nr:hypothetical protein [Kocuria dechangensis]GGG68271.1 hypothetical protein GCM10011374_35780 [Kocuria dechangensis]
MSNSPHPAPITRRTLIGAGTLAGLSAVLTTGPAHAGQQPAAAAPGYVLWGSSSANSGLGDQYPRTTQNPWGVRGSRPVVRIENVLDGLLGATGTVTALGADTSYQTLRMRSYDHPYRPDFTYNGGRGELPARDGLIVSTTDRIVPNWRKALPGTIDGIPCTIQAERHRFSKVRVVRQDAGTELTGQEVVVGEGPTSYWHTDLERQHRGKVHLIWTGKNNIWEYDQVLSDTRAAFDVEPATSVVMGHWHAWNDRSSSPVNHERVYRVNAAYRTEYGTRYFDAMAALKDPGLWELPLAREFNVGYTAKDREWMSLGLPPYSLVGTDNMHLNAVGNTIIAHALHRFLTGTAGLY